jgi:protein SCO1/2
VDDLPRLDREAPPLALPDQHGDTVRLAALRGRPVVVAFAYKHCTTVCPLVVYEVLNAQRQLAERRVAVVLVTLDPWRDTPQRLGEIAQAWQLPEDAHVLSGGVEDVNRTLDAWEVPRARDEATGEITHGEPVYLLDAAGRMRYKAPGYADAIVRLSRRL